MRMDLLDKYSTEELLARVLQAEAGNQGKEGIAAVLSVIRNRVKSGKYPNTLRGVLTQKGQFSPVNYYTGHAGGEQGVDFDKIKPSSLTRQVMAETQHDPTGGALNFVNPSVSNPNWYNPETFSMIGDHAFGTAGAKHTRSAGVAPRRAGVPGMEPPAPPQSMAGLEGMVAAQEQENRRQAGLDARRPPEQQGLRRPKMVDTEAMKRKQEHKKAMSLLALGQQLLGGNFYG